MPKVRITKKFSGTGDPKQWIQSKIDKIESANRESMTEALQEGENIMRHFIETRGTADSGKRGRIETGKMLGAVNSKIIEQNKQIFRGSFGWIDLQENYFFYQENGFHHVRSGKMIEGMYALQDSASEVWVNLRENLGRNARDA